MDAIRLLLVYSAVAIVAAMAGFIVAFVLGGSTPSSVLNELPGLEEEQRTEVVQLAQSGNGLHKLIRHAQPQPAPVLSFTDGDGQTKSLADFRGKVVLLNFWATWCAPCKIEMSSLDALQAKLGGENFTVVALSVDRTGPDKPREFLQKAGLSNLALYVDDTGESALAVKAGGLPATLILDEQGREVARLLGSAEWDDAEAVKLVQSFTAYSGSAIN